MSRDVIRCETRVSVAPDRAFELFTDDIDKWWRRGSRFRWLTGGGALRFAGGELVEDGDEGRFVVGRVLAWEPPARLAFEWRAPSFAPNERTFVDVRFAADGDGTRVVLEHRGWDAIRKDHPARRGTGFTPAFSGLMGLYWANLLGGLARAATAR